MKYKIIYIYIYIYMDEDIEARINEFKNDENISMSTPIDNIVNDINLDEIIDNQEIVGNEIVQYISKNTDISKEPYISTVLYFYFKKCYDVIFKNKYQNKVLSIILRLFHLLEVIFIIFGWLLPSKFLSLYIIICIKNLILWDIFDNDHYISLLIQKITKDKYFNLFNENIVLLKSLILFVIIISIFGISFPTFSIFNINYKIISNLKKYN